MQTNIITLLEKILRHSEGQPGCVNITADDRAFIETYLYGQGVELQAKASFIQAAPTLEGLRPVNEHFFVKGNPVDIFTLLTSMAHQCPNFAHILTAAGKYVRNTIPICKTCFLPHSAQSPCGDMDSGDMDSWTFYKPNTTDNEQKPDNPGAPANGL